ncbi:hypothetical protein COV82_02055 [Candidatus Peregrinibacteria bacterium CG11_big_fil_rev_8_21_14_0_20_46_8]|nr:MAG: hypothetical protein COV82_02055 [Candidatus Peregrinibacteria bacterium CG11_big_fil_rev_8_21_14_0_20_46_8]
MNFVKKHYILSAVLVSFLLFALWICISFFPFLRFFLHPFALAGGEKHYLVLLQNNYELRPTGGFISAFGILTIKNGVPISLNLEDVYGTVDDHSYVAPPYPLGRLLAHSTYQGHTFRDANFDPDFPSSVAELESFLRKTRPFQTIDGVIAVDFGFVENWLDAVGSIEVDGRAFTAETLLEFIEAEVADVDLHSLEDLPRRKEGVRQLGKKLAIKTALPWNLPRFFSSVHKSFREKHALFFFHDDDLQQIVEKKGWGGVLQARDGEDLLAVVDANYGGGKANRYVTRSIFYDVDLEKGRAALDIRYDHTNDITVPLSLNYRGYVRAFVPQDHIFGGNIVRGANNNLNYAGQIFEVPAQGKRSISFPIQFPLSLFDDLSYSLYLWKQPGTYNDYYSISVKIPVGLRLTSDDFEVRDNVAIFKGFLTEDRRISFRIDGDNLPPRAIRQTVTALNVLELEFNEGIDPASLRPDKWTVNDTDFAVSERHDLLRIRDVRLEGNTVKIFTIGMSRQPEERYLLEIDGIFDRRGNPLGRRTYSFFQRL